MIEICMNVTKDCVVSIDYTLFDDHGEVLDTSNGLEPLLYLHGSNAIIPGLEKALEGKVAGDTFSVTVPAAEAYGLRDEQLVVEVPLDRFKGADAVEAGMQFQAETSEGSQIVTVTSVGNGMATIDANHPLAGKDLTFDITVVSIRPATAEEIEHGHPHIDSNCDGDCCDEGGDCSSCH
jgi:FKBP-type peptidyl-prolyl cis-trans isomerase SlyD